MEVITVIQRSYKRLKHKQNLYISITSNMKPHEGFSTIYQFPNIAYDKEILKEDGGVGGLADTSHHWVPRLLLAQ